MSENKVYDPRITPEQTADAMQYALVTFSPEERVDFLYYLSRYFCLSCGIAYPKKLENSERSCSCWNDE